MAAARTGTVDTGTLKTWPAPVSTFARAAAVASAAGTLARQLNGAAHTDAGGLWKRHVSETNVWRLKVGGLVTVSRLSLSDPTHDAPQSVLEHFAVGRLQQTFSPKQD